MGIDVRDGPAQRRAAMAWTMLVLAGAFEVIWAFFLKQSHGFTRLAPTIGTLLAMAVSIGLLSLSMRVVPLGTAYTVWTGIGAVGAFLVGITVLGEQASTGRVLAAVLIVIGIVLMALFEADAAGS
jgi:quaternary ammonium compound-resistance protein SugE